MAARASSVAETGDRRMVFDELAIATMYSAPDRAVTGKTIGCRERDPTPGPAATSPFGDV